MRIVLDIGQVTIEQLRKLVDWLDAAPLPINPGELYTEVGIQNVKVVIKAPKIVPAQPEKKQ
jgi:hypothetical protein